MGEKTQRKDERGCEKESGKVLGVAEGKTEMQAIAGMLQIEDQSNLIRGYKEKYERNRYSSSEIKRTGESGR